jgi:hypothetical protein
MHKLFQYNDDPWLIMGLISFFRNVELYFLFYIKLGRTYARNTNVQVYRFITMIVGMLLLRT